MEGPDRGINVRILIYPHTLGRHTDKRFRTRNHTLPNMSRVTIVSGIAHMKKYNKAVLFPAYQQIGYEVVDHVKFPMQYLFCCHLHNKLDDTIKRRCDNKARERSEAEGV